MSRKDVGKIVEITKNDFKSAFANPIVTLLLIAIIILPSLYALINIQACWNPYDNTNEVAFAIANLDNGTSVDGVPINIGNELVMDLKNNTKFNWTFVTEEELREGVNNGKYYAGIILPKNLSENVVSITTDDPKPAELEYVVNIKANPVASRLTDAGSNAIYTALNAKIVQFIDLAAYGKLGELQQGLASGAGQLASGGSQLQSGAGQVASGAGQVASGAQKITNGSHTVQQASSQISSGAKNVSQGAQQVQQGSDELQASVDSSLMPNGPVKQYAQSSAQLANGSSQLAYGSSYLAQKSAQLANGSSELAENSALLSQGALSLAAGAQMLSGAATQALFAASGALAASANSLAGITGINETLLGDYFFSPVKLNRHEVFPVPDYGSSVAPFYLVLSMWVGALITCVLIEPKSSVGTPYSPFEMYTGKLLIYVILSILQACVTLIGAQLLGIYISNYPLFIFSAILVSVVFMILIYSIISAIGTVGKGVAVILLVFQISGTGGIYPIEIMPKLFQALHPYLPMTYAISLIREAQLGVVWSNYWPALIILLAIGTITVIVAMIIKEKADKASKYFEEKLEESELF
ncbi:MAG: YhgE/Pip domain-containing protein [Methanobrevibacter sp.]|nr:YhgE/Pip domain-containing protein [Methanobrevibacter sp.]